jgi:hypothetical protein
MKVRVDILRWENSGEEPKVLHSLAHETHSIQAVDAAAQGVIASAELSEANGYRIVTESGTELYGFAD